MLRTPCRPGFDSLGKLLACLLTKPLFHGLANLVIRSNGRGDVEIRTFEEDADFLSLGDFEAILASQIPVGGSVDITGQGSVGIHCGEIPTLGQDPLPASLDFFQDVPLRCRHGRGEFQAAIRQDADGQSPA